MKKATIYQQIHFQNNTKELADHRALYNNNYRVGPAFRQGPLTPRGVLTYHAVPSTKFCDDFLFPIAHEVQLDLDA